MSQIIELVKQASQSKAPISRLADRISLFFVPTVIGLSLITFIVWVSLGFGGVLTDVNNPLDLAFQLSVSVLVNYLYQNNQTKQRGINIRNNNNNIPCFFYTSENS